MHKYAEKLQVIIGRIDSKKLDDQKIHEDIKITNNDAIIKAECETRHTLSKELEIPSNIKDSY
jgi:hypothetical protein